MLTSSSFWSEMACAALQPTRPMVNMTNGLTDRGVFLARWCTWAISVNPQYTCHCHLLPRPSRSIELHCSEAQLPTSLRPPHLCSMLCSMDSTWPMAQLPTSATTGMASLRQHGQWHVIWPIRCGLQQRTYPRVVPEHLVYTDLELLSF